MLRTGNETGQAVPHSFCPFRGHAESLTLHAITWWEGGRMKKEVSLPVSSQGQTFKSIKYATSALPRNKKQKEE